MKYDRKDDIIDCLKCAAFVASIFALSTGIVLLTVWIDKVIS